jgi:hypothetical protein
MKQAFGVAFVPKNVRNAVPIGGGSLVMFKGLNRRAEGGRLEVRQVALLGRDLGGWSRFTGYFAPRKSPMIPPR